MRIPSWLLSIPLLLAAPASALAQPADVHGEANDDFRQGREAFGRGDYQSALKLFQVSQSLEPGPGKLLNIALCEEQLGQLEAASRHLNEVVAQLPPGDDRVPIARQHLADLAPKIARAKADAAPPARVAPPAKPPAALSPAPPAAPPPEAPPATSGRRTAGFVVGGIGIASLVAGGVTGALSFADHGSAESACPSHRGCSQGVIDQASTGKSLSIVSTVTLAAGAVGAGVGLYLVLSSKKPAPAASVGLTLLPGGGGLGLGGRF